MFVSVGSKYLVPLTFKTKEEAYNQYDEILNIILTYQEKIPFSKWRKDKDIEIHKQKMELLDYPLSDRLEVKGD